MTLGRIMLIVNAGDIQPTNQPTHPVVGKQVRMGDSGLTLNITPATARQWIGVLEPIAKEEK